MTARVGRLAGALLVEAEGAFYLVGNTKEPCDFAAAGFEPPAEPIDALVRPVVRLQAMREVTLRPPALICGETEKPGTGTGAEGIARRLAESFLIERNGSVSERLWRLVVQAGEDDAVPAAEIDARWLMATPPGIWRVVRDTVLRCS